MQVVKEKSVYQIKEAVIKVIVFFDMFDFPLTSFEVWKYLNIKCELADVISVMDKINEEKFLEFKNGFYFLAGRGEIVDVRMSRYNAAGRKMKKVVIMAKIFKVIPWIKMIAVGNIMGGNNAKTDSDIDLFIVTENKRIWITRFFCVLITKLLGLRPALDRMKDKICLSFFVSEGAIDLKGLMLYKITDRHSPCRETVPELDNVTGQCPVTTVDIYIIYWLACLEPVYDAGKTYENFIAANSWIYKILPNWQPFIGTRWRDAEKSFSFFYHDIIDLFLGGLEKNLRNWQIKILPAEIKDLMNKDSRVVVNENILKFHINDRRDEYRTKYLENLLVLKNKIKDYYN